ncbi:hypothetical protein [Anaerosporobacter sp.]|uniref:hypothetical protein n=1 Tax=Anaerosporobacter sp. TaxID=1872529 RepID=UPI00286FA9AD|nr:hypothetical protein [Anaerosporobacter sp.]
MKKNLLLAFLLCLVLAGNACDSKKEDEDMVKEKQPVGIEEEIEEVVEETEEAEEGIIDLYDYIDCDKQEFLDKTGLEIERLEESDNTVYEEYSGYKEYDYDIFSVYFYKDKVQSINFSTEVPGYSFLGIKLTMYKESVIEILNKAGYVYEVEEENHPLLGGEILIIRVYLDEEKETKLTIHARNGEEGVEAIFYERASDW